MNQTKPQLMVIGSLNMDIVIETERCPAPGETVLGERVSFVPGGKGANQAVAAARLGAEAVMVGAVGQDLFGEQLLASLRENQVQYSSVVRTEAAATGVASIYLSEGDNRIVVVPGANGELKPEVLKGDEFLAALQKVDLVMLQLEIPLETVLYVAKLAKGLGKKVLLNPAPAQVLPEELYPCLDYLTPNRTELAAFTGMEILDDESLKAAMQLLQTKGAAHVITTLGASGSAYLDEAGELVAIPGYRVAVKDTTGAGDCFNAGLACAVARGQSLQEAVKYGTLVSALAVTRFGAQSGMPTEKEAEAAGWVFEPNQ